MRLKEVVVSPCNLLDGLGKLQPLFSGQVDQRANMSLGKNQDLKRPDTPPGNNDKEVLILKHCALLLLNLDLDVVRQQVPSSVLITVLAHLHQLGTRLLRHGGRCPDLAMRVRVRAAHGGALVLEYLHVAQVVLGLGHGARGRRGGQLEGGGDLGQRVRGGEMGGVDLRPDVDDGGDLCRRHVGERDVVLLGEGEHVALARGRFRAQQGRGEVCSSCNVRVRFA